MTALTKITSKSSCQTCGAALRLAASGRRKRFCSDACRQAAFRNKMTANKAPSYPTKGYENFALELIEIQDDFLSRNEELEFSRSSARSSKQLKFEKQNSVTYKMTDGQQVNTGGGRSSRALGYVIEMFPGRWMARARNLGNNLLPFGAAKQEAIRLYQCCDEGPLDWISELNLRSAGEVDRAVLANEKRSAPIDLMNGGKPWLNPVHVDREVSRNVIEVETCNPLREEDTRQETLKDHDYLIECDADGYPELPPCLDRRNPSFRQAA